MSTMPSSSVPFGGFLQDGAIVAVVAIGFKEVPALPGTMISANAASEKTAIVEVDGIGQPYLRRRPVAGAGR